MYPSSRSAPDHSRVATVLAFVDYVDGPLSGTSSAGGTSCVSSSSTVAHVARLSTLPTACSDRASDVPESRLGTPDDLATPSASMEDTIQALLEPYFVSPKASCEVAAYVQASSVSSTVLKAA